MQVMLRSIPVQVKLVRWESIRTDRTGLRPGVKECARLRLRAGRGLAVSSRSPGPADQRILAHVMDDVFEGAAAIAGRIFDLLTNLRRRLALPTHLMRRQTPAWIARHSGAFEIGRLVADLATHRRKSKAVFAALDRRLMQTPDVALTRAIAGGMAVHTARMGQHFAGLGEQSCGARRRIADCVEAGNARETFRRTVRNGRR
jgi:hypothetical protein